ncbi:MAG: rhodanese-like domain-containing protein [Deferribacteraceae bacterium]|jgi:rhodanese-related sulfurtransferase|nr:rhodanese-like domain-containing protein [Deferribacteraceae bacterium]
MKKLLVVVLMLTMMVGVVQAAEIQITAKDSKAMIEKNAKDPNFIIIDIRTPEEYADSHIDKAINIDFYADDFSDKLAKLDKNKTYMVYCRSGNRSGKAMPTFDSLGFKTVYHMVDGYKNY